MLKDRRLWFLAPVLVALVLLLGFTRRTPTPAAPAAASPDAPVAVAATPAPATAEVEDGDDAPRHSDIGFRTPALLQEHYRKHGREFHAKRATSYLRLAQRLRETPRSEEVLVFLRNDAVTCKFDRGSGAFIAYDSDGTIRTFFRPRDGEAYFERQKLRAHETP